VVVRRRTPQIKGRTARDRSEPPARNDVGRGIFLGDPHRILPDGDQCPHAEEANIPGLPGDDAEDDGARPVETVDPGMMLARRDVEAELVAEEILVEGFLEELGRDLGVAIFVGQAGPNRICAIEHVLGDEGIRVLAVKPGVHPLSLSRPRRRIYHPGIEEGDYGD
jgi:hypothetical protein